LVNLPISEQFLQAALFCPKLLFLDERVVLTPWKLGTIIEVLFLKASVQLNDGKFECIAPLVQPIYPFEATDSFSLINSLPGYGADRFPLFFSAGGIEAINLKGIDISFLWGQNHLNV